MIINRPFRSPRLFNIQNLLGMIRYPCPPSPTINIPPRARTSMFSINSRITPLLFIP